MAEGKMECRSTCRRLCVCVYSVHNRSRVNAEIWVVLSLRDFKQVYICIVDVNVLSFPLKCAHPLSIFVVVNRLLHV